MMYDELKFHMFIICVESMERVHEAYRKVWIKFQLFEEKTKGSEHKDWQLKTTFIGC